MLLQNIVGKIVIGLLKTQERLEGSLTSFDEATAKLFIKSGSDVKEHNFVEVDNLSFCQEGKDVCFVLEFHPLGNCFCGLEILHKGKGFDIKKIVNCQRCSKGETIDQPLDLSVRSNENDLAARSLSTEQ